MKFQYRKHSHSVCLLLAHIVITTKYRKSTLQDQYGLKFFQSAVAKYGNRFTIEQMETDLKRDHAHLLVQFTNTVTIAYIVQIIKGITSKLIKENYCPNWQGWDVGYFASTTGGSSLQAVQEYIANQRKA